MLGRQSRLGIMYYAPLRNSRRAPLSSIVCASLPPAEPHPCPGQHSRPQSVPLPFTPCGAVPCSAVGRTVTARGAGHVGPASAVTGVDEESTGRGGGPMAGTGPVRRTRTPGAVCTHVALGDEIKPRPWKDSVWLMKRRAAAAPVASPCIPLFRSKRNLLRRPSVCLSVALCC